MAVSIPSDLVADVMRAADPARLRSATARLSAPGQPVEAGAPAFAAVLEAQGSAPSPAAGEVPLVRPLEQFVWQGLFEAMLPVEESGAFGSGPGAGIWRSMAATQLAAVATQAAGSALIPASEDAPRDGLAALNGWPYFASAPIRSYAG